MNMNQKRYLRWEQAIITYVGKEFDAGRMDRAEALHYTADPFAIYPEAMARAVGVTFKELRDHYTIRHGFGDQLGSIVKGMSVEQAFDRCEEMFLNMDLTKAKVRKFAKRLQEHGIFLPSDVSEVDRMCKDRDWCAEDVLSEVRSTLLSLSDPFHCV